MKKIVWMKPSITTDSHRQTSRIILLDLYWSRDKDPRVSLGHASLLASLKKDKNLDTRSLIYAVNEVKTIETIVQDVNELLIDDDVDYIDLAVGMYIWNEDLVQGILTRIRNLGFQGRIILGGPQISFADQNLESLYPQADVFVRGNGEDALCQIVRSPSKQTITGVHFAGTLDLGLQAKTDLSTLPSPWLTGEIPLKHQKFLRWETQRGCQFKCSFCQHRQKDHRAATTYFSTSRLHAEIDHICDMGVMDVAVLDPIFNSDETHAIDVLHRFSDRQFKGKLSLQCRAEMISDAFLDALSGLNVCLEFGLQTIHPKEYLAIGRPNNVKKINTAFKNVRERGIDHEVSLIFGLPEQTVESFIESVNWCLEHKVPVIKAFPLLLLRGTQLDLDREKWGLKQGHGKMPNVEESTTFCRHEWLQMEKISQALSDTEHCHPNLKTLLAKAKLKVPDTARFQPNIGEQAS
jgi:hypothetical protein